jgi:lysozyme family protein
MADFAAANAVVSFNEGGYANHPADKGGETYAGITRKYFPNWEGWSAVDRAKPLKTNAKIPALTPLVTKFYRETLWDANNLASIANQQVANNVLDSLVLHGYGAHLVQQAAVQAGAPIVVDGRLGAKTIAALNALDPVRFVRLLIARRLVYMKQLSEWPTFAAGWTKRLENLGRAIGATLSDAVATAAAAGSAAGSAAGKAGGGSSLPLLALAAALAAGLVSGRLRG